MSMRFFTRKVPAILFFACANLAMAQIASDLDNLWQPPDGIRKRSSSYNTQGLNRDFIAVKSGDRHTLCDLRDVSGSIQRIWFTISSSDSSYLKTIQISMNFDGDTTAANIPVGMFSGTGPWRVNDLNSSVLNVMRARRTNRDQNGVGSGSFNIHWPMPFSSNAGIEMYNGTDGEIRLFYYIDYVALSHKTAPLLFHADYHIQSPTKPADTDRTLNTSRNYRFLKIDGYQGKYAGTILAVESHPDRQGKWYEGDDMFVIDNQAWPPALHGTGTEDYFGMAWGFHRPYQAFDHGVSHFEKNITDHDRFFDGRYVTYRFHIHDPILFHHSIDASIEAGFKNECAQHYESVAIWYGRRNKPDFK